MLGRITRKEIAEMAQKENRTMTYEQFVKKSESGEKGTLRELSKFAKESPELYQQYRERYHREQDEQTRLHNRRLTENTFKNKPFSIRIVANNFTPARSFPVLFANFTAISSAVSVY